MTLPYRDSMQLTDKSEFEKTGAVSWKMEQLPFVSGQRILSFSYKTTKFDNMDLFLL